MDNFDLRKYLTEGRLLKENVSPEELWPEWAQGEKEVGNDMVLNDKGNIIGFSSAKGETKEVFMEYVKAVKTLNASSKELRDDIAMAISGIFYGGGDFEDYSFDVLTADQFTKIQDII
jgi:hypothetical protein